MQANAPAAAQLTGGRLPGVGDLLTRNSTNWQSSITGDDTKCHTPRAPFRPGPLNCLHTEAMPARLRLCTLLLPRGTPGRFVWCLRVSYTRSTFRFLLRLWLRQERTVARAPCAKSRYHSPEKSPPGSLHAAVISMRSGSVTAFFVA